MNRKENQLYIKQGLAWQELLSKTSFQGAHQKKIAEIEVQLKKAQLKTAEPKHGSR